MLGVTTEEAELQFINTRLMQEKQPCARVVFYEWAGVDTAHETVQVTGLGMPKTVLSDNLTPHNLGMSRLQTHLLIARTKLQAARFLFIASVVHALQFAGEAAMHWWS